MSNVVEIERALLGCLLTDPVKANLQEIAELIKPSDFSTNDNQKIYMSFYTRSALVIDANKTINEAYKDIIGGLNTTIDAQEIQRLKTYLRELRDSCIIPMNGIFAAYQLKEETLRNSIWKSVEQYISFKMENSIDQ